MRGRGGGAIGRNTRGGGGGGGSGSFRGGFTRGGGAPRHENSNFYRGGSGREFGNQSGAMDEPIADENSELALSGGAPNPDFVEAAAYDAENKNGGQCGDNVDSEAKLGGGEETGENANTSRTSNDDNLRDIGTWSNEHAASKRKPMPGGPNQQQQSQKQPQQAGHRYNSKVINNSGNVNTGSVGGGANGAVTSPQANTKSGEDWENEEEWQGDLTKTQIFTASTQKKEASAADAK